MWSLLVLPVATWASSGYSSFLPPSKNMQITSACNLNSCSKLPIGVNGCLSLCVPCDRLVTCTGWTQKLAGIGSSFAYDLQWINNIENRWMLWCLNSVFKCMGMSSVGALSLKMSARCCNMYHVSWAVFPGKRKHACLSAHKTEVLSHLKVSLHAYFKAPWSQIPLGACSSFLTYIHALS